MLRNFRKSLVVGLSSLLLTYGPSVQADTKTNMVVYFNPILADKGDIATVASLHSKLRLEQLGYLPLASVASLQTYSTTEKFESLLRGVSPPAQNPYAVQLQSWAVNRGAFADRFLVSYNNQYPAQDGGRNTAIASGGFYLEFEGFAIDPLANASDKFVQLRNDYNDSTGDNRMLPIGYYGFSNPYYSFPVTWANYLPIPSPLPTNIEAIIGALRNAGRPLFASVNTSLPQDNSFQDRSSGLLARLLRADVGRHVITTEGPYPSFQYKIETQWAVPNAVDRRFPTNLVSYCEIPLGNSFKTFLTYSDNCEGGEFLGSFLTWQTPGPGMTPLYGCMNGQADGFITSDGGCEGQSHQVPLFLGYASPVTDANSRVLSFPASATNRTPATADPVTVSSLGYQSKLVTQLARGESSYFILHPAKTGHLYLTPDDAASVTVTITDMDDPSNTASSHYTGDCRLNRFYTGASTCSAIFSVGSARSYLIQVHQDSGSSSNSEQTFLYPD